MRKNDNKFYLSPVDGRKSFYGKAYMLSENGGISLYSYGTKVCSCVNGKVVKHWNDYSVTTMRHVNAFVQHCGIAGGGKAWWTSLPYVRS